MAHKHSEQIVVLNNRSAAVMPDFIHSRSELCLLLLVFRCRVVSRCEQGFFDRGSQVLVNGQR